MLESHLQTVTSLAFREIQIVSQEGQTRKNVHLFTAGADRLLTANEIDSEKLPEDLETLQLGGELFSNE